jgi:DNA-binding CsgD family transcriptional regulator
VKQNGNKHGQGRKNGATEIATLSLKEQAIKLFLDGCSIEQIAEKLNRSIKSIYPYVNSARLELIRNKKEHFEERLAILLDDSMDVIATQSQLLNNVDWLKTADPARIDSISRATGILFDKCFVLLAGWGNRRVQPAAGEIPAVAGIGTAER